MSRLSTTTPIISKNHLPSIDGWRAISITMVLGAHSAVMPEFGTPFSQLVELFPPLFDGNLGVRFFFVISGFLITHLLIQERLQTGKVSLENFYVRRCLRILPVYVAYLVVCGILQLTTGLHQSLITWIGNLTFTVNFLPRGVISGHLWSLAVEEQFYLIWPLTFVWLSPQNKRPLWIFTLPVLAAILCHTINLLGMPPKIIHPLFHIHSSLLNFDSLAVGCLAAFLLADHRQTLVEILTPIRLIIASGAGLLLVLAPLSSSPCWVNFFFKILGSLVQAVGFSLLLLTSVLAPEYFAPLNWRWVAQIGIASYSIYIWQQLFFAAPQIYDVRHNFWFSFPGWLLGAISLGFLSYHGFEKPLLKLRQRFRRF